MHSAAAPHMPTEEQLAQAWAQLVRPEWQLDMAQTRQAWLHWCLVLQRASLLARGVHVTDPADALAEAPPPPAPQPPIAPPAHPARPLTYPAHRYHTGGAPFDVKRAAAGDRDDE